MKMIIKREKEEKKRSLIFKIFRWKNLLFLFQRVLLLFSCNNCNTQVSSSDKTIDTISSIKRDTIVNKDTIAPIQAPKEETDEATKMILEFYDKYIRQQDKMPCGEFCEEELREIEREFLSSKLIRKVNSDELSSDPIVRAQDIFIEWLALLRKEE